MLRDVQLPPTFRMHAIAAPNALREFELGYDYRLASTSEVCAIESELFLNVGAAYPIFQPVLDLFSSGVPFIYTIRRFAFPPTLPPHTHHS